MVTSSDIRAVGTASLMNRIGAGSVEDFANTARLLHAAPNECGQLQLAVDLAVRLIAGCDHAGVSIVEGRGIRTPVGSDDVVRCGDALQYELDEGPCLDSVRKHQTVASQDLSREERWPRWSPRVRTELGIQGMMSLWLYTNGASYGALNLYADQIEAFQSQDHAIEGVGRTDFGISGCTPRAPAA